MKERYRKYLESIERKKYLRKKLLMFTLVSIIFIALVFTPIELLNLFYHKQFLLIYYIAKNISLFYTFIFVPVGLFLTYDHYSDVFYKNYATK